MIGLLKFLKGYVRIKLWGFSPERFMNLCSNKDILLWDIVKEDEMYFMNISLSGFYQLRSIVKKTGTRVAIIKRYGLPFFMPVLWARKIFVIGLLLCVAFWVGSSWFIWDIELSGNYQITQDVFNTFLKQHEVDVGMKKSELNIEELEKQIRQEFPAVTWTSAKLNGTKLTIEIKENDAPIISAIKEEEGGKDLISPYSGTIKSIIVRSGVPKVAIGDTIEQGAMLVEGRVPVYNEDATVKEYQYVASDADIYMEHILPYEEKIPFDYIKKMYTGRTKKRYFLRIGDKELKIVEEQPFLVYDCVIRENKPALFEKLSIPVFWGSLTYREYANVEYEYSHSQAKELLETKLKEFLTTLTEKGVQIIEKNVKIDTDSGMWTSIGEIKVVEKVGDSVDTTIENLQDTGEIESNE